ncbi:MAG: hypothetical protein AAF755_10375 [Pseudomonadota bacterium]
MALSFPLARADFFDLLPIARITLRPNDSRTFTETAGGELIPAGRAVPLWRGSIALDKERHRLFAELESKLTLLEQTGASFLLYDPRQPFPAADPGGAILGQATPMISALAANNREIDLSGLPAGYEISAGDLIGWTYGAAPTRYALHRVVTGATASGSGTARDIELAPFLRPGLALNTPVTLVRPLCKAVLEEAEYGGGRSVITEGTTFKWRQTLR